jgi:hypothetical protein
MSEDTLEEISQLLLDMENNQDWLGSVLVDLDDLKRIYTFIGNLWGKDADTFSLIKFNKENPIRKKQNE